MSMVLKRRAIVAGVVLLACTGLAACKSSGGSSGGKGTITIGVVGPQSGVSAQSGEEQVHAAQVAADVVNAKGGVLGKKVKIVAKDSQNESVTADIQNFRDLHAKGVQYVVGFQSSAVCLGLGPIAKQLDMLYFGQCSDPSLLASNGPSTFYMAANVVVSDTIGLTNVIKSDYASVPCWSVYSLDYVTGHTVASTFVSELKQKVPSAKIVTQVFAPLGTSDVRSYISALESASPEGSDCGLYAYAYAGAGITFMKQAALAGLFSHYKVFAWHGASDDAMSGIGAKTAPYVGVSEFFPPAYAGVNSVNKDATAQWQKAYGKPFSWGAYAPYDSMLAIFAAMEKAGSTDVKKVQPALDGLTFDSVKGPITIKNRYFVQSGSRFDCKGDASAANGWSCSGGAVLPAEAVTPQQYM